MSIATTQSGAAHRQAASSLLAPHARVLEDRVVVVTGGSRGIGRSIVMELTNHGAKVVFTYAHNREASEALVAQLGQQVGVEVLALHADVRDFQSAQDVVAQTIERFGRLDGVVNNAGIVRDKALMLMPPEEWRDVIDTNLTGVFNTCRAAIVTLMKQRDGRIVNITSVSGLVGAAGQVNYSASKAGIVGLTKALAKEVAGYHITVNAIAPGYVDTDMTHTMDDTRRAQLEKEIPLGRFGHPAEVAGVVTMLLSDIGSYITGQVIVVDGGLAI